MKTMLKVVALVLALSASAQAFMEYFQETPQINASMPELILNLEDIQNLDLSETEKKKLLESELQKFIQNNKLNIFDDDKDIFGVGEPGV